MAGGSAQALEASGQTGEPRYMEILMPMHYEQHVLRRPAAGKLAVDPVNAQLRTTSTPLRDLVGLQAHDRGLE